MREQNRVAERKHRHILEITHALLISSSVPRTFWKEVVLTSVNLINITLSSWLKSHLTGISILLPRTIACSACLGVPVMSFFLRPSAPSYLADQLSVSYSASVLSIRVIIAMIHWHVVFLYPVMSSSLRTLLIFLFHLRMFTFCRHLIHHLLSPLEYLLI